MSCSNNGQYFPEARRIELATLKTTRLSDLAGATL